MAVITDIYSDFNSCCTEKFKDAKCRCNACGNPLHFYPFLEWRGAVDFYLCAECCREVKHGLIADLIQVAAIKEMHDTDVAVYGEYTLVRKRISVLEAEEKLKWPPIQNLSTHSEKSPSDVRPSGGWRNTMSLHTPLYLFQYNAGVKTTMGARHGT
jgi:hypothetical protein